MAKSWEGETGYHDGYIGFIYFYTHITLLSPSNNISFLLSAIFSHCLKPGVRQDFILLIVRRSHDSGEKGKKKTQDRSPSAHQCEKVMHPLVELPLINKNISKKKREIICNGEKIKIPQVQKKRKGNKQKKQKNNRLVGTLSWLLGTGNGLRKGKISCPQK